MRRATTTGEYHALAEFRFLIRRFLNNGEKAARSVGLEPQQYMGLLALSGLPSGQEPTIRSLAERLQIQHHSAVELVDRMERRGLFRRERSRRDRSRRKSSRLSLRSEGQTYEMQSTVPFVCLVMRVKYKKKYGSYV